jgi:hypothetical protein
MSSVGAPQRELSFRDFNVATVFALLVVLPTLALTAWFLANSWSTFDPILLAWIALVSVVELRPAPAWRGINVSVGFTILTAVGMTFSPGWAATAALLGSSDPAELRRETSLLKALFNRSQIAVAVFLASVTFHALASVEDNLPKIALAAIPTSLVDYLTNLGLVIVIASLLYRVPVLRLARQLPRVQEFLVSYLGLAVLGAVLAKMNHYVGLPAL